MGYPSHMVCPVCWVPREVPHRAPAIPSTLCTSAKPVPQTPETEGISEVWKTRDVTMQPLPSLLHRNARPSPANTHTVLSIMLSGFEKPLSKSFQKPNCHACTKTQQEREGPVSRGQR